MPDYQKGKIYKLWSPSKNLVYYGSTTQTLSQRLAEHSSDFKNKKKQVSSYKILECEDYKIELVEEYPCNNKQQLLKKEGEYIKANECINKIVSGRTLKEYYKDNKKILNEKMRKYSKIHYENNKEEIHIKRKEYYEATKEQQHIRGKIYRNNNIEKRQIYEKTYRETKKQNNAIYKWLLMTGIIV